MRALNTFFFSHVTWELFAYLTSTPFLFRRLWSPSISLGQRSIYNYHPAGGRKRSDPNASIASRVRNAVEKAESEAEGKVGTQLRHNGLNVKYAVRDSL